MSPDIFAVRSRAVGSNRSRRSALAAIAAAVVTSFSRGESLARKRNRKHKNKHKNKNKNKNTNKGKAQNCSIHHSEQQILGFIAKAANEYGQSRAAMERVARCESTLNPCAVNPAGPYYGLFQYLKSTWQSTPYGNRDIFDPEAQALATGWMWKQGRKDEWVCQ